MLLQIDVRKFVDCPDNICFQISFHETLDLACDAGYEFLSPGIGRDELRKLEPVWTNHDDYDESEGNGYHCQIIKFEHDKVITLNKYYEQIERESW
ncbi:MAG: hypothetical protein Harvfovirus14_14 [Harvfovirus sp.]|uniref:Uncharacterized protein n=1 Tax=Harvfovirus sp. TaxID=2487768 RepID=A0A3G5A5D5_9VIRU|nr:MAG: hypothetical protein Harvfovirus14_14 [Harvfovirus sp.]